MKKTTRKSSDWVPAGGQYRRSPTGKELACERNIKTGKTRWFYTATGATYRA